MNEAWHKRHGEIEKRLEMNERLKKRLQITFVISALLFFFGAIGMTLSESRYGVGTWLHLAGVIGLFIATLLLLTHWKREDEFRKLLEEHYGDTMAEAGRVLGATSGSLKKEK